MLCKKYVTWYGATTVSDVRPKIYNAVPYGVGLRLYEARKIKHVATLYRATSVSTHSKLSTEVPQSRLSDSVIGIFNATMFTTQFTSKPVPSVSRHSEELGHFTWLGCPLYSRICQKPVL